jgi:steroid 5-alpha reductase family enzyme
VSLVEQAAGAWAAGLALMSLVWVVSFRIDDVSIVDWAWGPVFVLLAWVYVATGHGPGPRAWMVAGAVSLWGSRLAVHLARRQRGEDPRYAAMRARAGAIFRWRSLFTVFWLQATLAWVVSWPLLVAIREGGALGAWGIAGLLLFAAGLGTEWIADRQLTRFRREGRSDGAVLDRGLWRYSRHPNYFGEAVLWWGLWLVAVGAGGAWTVYAPLLMTWLLIRVSGVPLLEKRLGETRPGYADYQRRTSAFVPWPPRRSAS